MQKGGMEGKNAFLLPGSYEKKCMISYAQKKGEKRILSFFSIWWY